MRNDDFADITISLKQIQFVTDEVDILTGEMTAVAGIILV